MIKGNRAGNQTLLLNTHRVWLKADFVFKLLQKLKLSQYAWDRQENDACISLPCLQLHVIREREGSTALCYTAKRRWVVEVEVQWR